MANKVTSKELQGRKDQYMFVDVREDELEKDKMDGASPYAIRTANKKGKAWRPKRS
jgi:hypothetical protein